MTAEDRGAGALAPGGAERQPARTDFQTRIGVRSDEVAESHADDPQLPAPAGLRAQRGAGQVSLRWAPVPGAMGYLVQRATAPGGPFTPVDHGGRDVLAVPDPRYVDTTGEPGRAYWYAVAALPDLERGPGPLSGSVQAASLANGGTPTVELVVHVDRPGTPLRRPWRMIGSERLSQLTVADRTGDRPIAEEFEAALRLARDELGARRVRAHAIFHDDLGVYRDGNGAGPVYDFSGIDEVYDRLLDLGLTPVVELSFMPRDLATDPAATVFGYEGVVSPPASWDTWSDLNRRLAQHLVERYGIDEVAHWGFEVWNEANLAVFWTGTQADYFQLYATAARAVKSVDERLLVGGPATAAAGWISDFLDYCQEDDVPLDFLSTHTYGNSALNLRAPLAARGLDHVEVWWTEWGITPTHFNVVTDGAFGGPFVLHGMKSAQQTTDALAYWVVSDHFEELGRPPALLHGGFGLLTVGNLRKARYWALALAEQLDDRLCEVELSGDGAATMVDAWASAAPDGRVDVLVWNGTLDQSKADGDPLLDRHVAVRLRGLAHGAYGGRIARVDAAHSDITSRWSGERDWPEPDEWEALRADDRLDEQPLAVTVNDGEAELALDLPMPGVARLRLEPTPQP